MRYSFKPCKLASAVGPLKQRCVMDVWSRSELLFLPLPRFNWLGDMLAIFFLRRLFYKRPGLSAGAQSLLLEAEPN